MFQPGIGIRAARPSNSEPDLLVSTSRLCEFAKLFIKKLANCENSFERNNLSFWMKLSWMERIETELRKNFTDF